MLEHPLLAQALHALAGRTPALGLWNEQATTAHAEPISYRTACAKFGNVAIVPLLKSNPRWQGDVELCTDQYGTLRFPFSDWGVTLYRQQSDDLDPISDHPITCHISDNRVTLRLPDDRLLPALAMSRDTFLRMLLQNDSRIDIEVFEFPHPTIRPRLIYAKRLGRSSIRYEPVGFTSRSDRACLTGTIVERLVEAIRLNSPAIYSELCDHVRTIRGFELPSCRYGLLGSFSKPTIPGEMGFNIPYTKEDQPQLDPFCFTWIGHELGHTRHYLIDDVAYLHGWRFVENPTDVSDMLPRYGRQLAMRTLFQVPYVHLYEWVLLMDFLEARFRGLPWNVAINAIEAGEEVRREIFEAFDIVRGSAKLTPLGRAVMAHMRCLVSLADSRWEQMLRNARAA